MKDLIKRLEAATGPSRELDLAIATAIHHAVLIDKTEHTARPFTSSLGEALELVPEGWGWTVGNTENHRFPIVTLYRSHPVNERICREHHTPALALCIAALKARLA